MKSSEEQRENVLYSISVSRETGSNVTVESDEHDEKHFLARYLTDTGIQMEHRQSHFEKALVPMSFKCDTGVNVTSERKR
jgi:hypothetical protein